MPGLRVGFLPQEPQLDPEHDRARGGRGGHGRGARAPRSASTRSTPPTREPDADFDALAAEQARLEAIIAASGADTDVQMEIAADALRLPPWDAKIGNLSGGEKRRVALCRLLLSKPDMLLLDEPTNHLDAESVDWLEQFLAKFPGTVIAVTHDRYFLDNAAEWILELDRGYGIPYKGNYSLWLEQKEQRLATESKQEAARIKAMKQELEWVRQNPKGRQAKSKARIARFNDLASYEHQQRNETQRDLHSRRRAPGRRGDRVREREQGVRRQAPDRQPVVPRSGGRHRRASSGPTAPARPRCSASSPARRSRTRARSPSATRCRWRSSTRPANRCPTTRPRGRRSATARTSSPSAVRDAVARLPRPLQLQGPGPAEDGRRALRRRARPAAPRGDAAQGRQRAAARRAVQRPRRRDAARARGGAARVRRQRARDLARPLVPRSHRARTSSRPKAIRSGSSTRATTGLRGRQAEAPGRGRRASRIASATRR